MVIDLETVYSPQMRHTLSLVILGDTHELHREVDVPDADILIHVGDFTMLSKSTRAVADFNTWLGELPHRVKLIVPGNHEFFLESDPSMRVLLHNALVLINEEANIDGLRIWGSPVTPLYGGAFGMSSAEDRREHYSQIPDGIDVLITHGAPFGILDMSPGSGFHQGCRELFIAVERIRPKLHAFGHVHGAFGHFETDHTTFINAALLGLDGALDRTPFVVRMVSR